MRFYLLLLIALIPHSLLPLSRSSEEHRISVDDRRDFTLLDLAAGQTKLLAVEAKLGMAKHSQIKNRLDPLVMICYVAPGTDHTRVEFTAHAEGDVLSDIRVTAGLVKANSEAGCATSDMISKDVMTDSGLRLGLTRAEVFEQFGVPNRTDSGTLIYESDRRLTEKEVKEKCGENTYCSQLEWWLHGQISLTFQNGTLVSFDIYRSQTN